MDRIFKIYKNDTWKNCEFKRLKEGDVFKIYDGGELVYGINGKCTFIAKSDAHIGYDDEYIIDVDEIEELDTDRFKVGDKVIPIEGEWADGLKYKIVSDYCSLTDTLYIEGLKGFWEWFEVKRYEEDK